MFLDAFEESFCKNSIDLAFTVLHDISLEHLLRTLRRSDRFSSSPQSKILLEERLHDGDACEAAAGRHGRSLGEARQEGQEGQEGIRTFLPFLRSLHFLPSLQALIFVIFSSAFV